MSVCVNASLAWRRPSLSSERGRPQAARGCAMPQNGTQKQDTTEDWQSAWSARLGARGRVIKYRPREHPCGYAVPFVPPLPLTRWDGCCSWGVLYEVSTYSYTEVGAEQNNDFRPSAVRAKVGAQHTSHPGENLVSHPHQKCPLKVLKNTPTAQGNCKFSTDHTAQPEF